MMEKHFFENKIFENLIARDNPLAPGDYDTCTFRNCNFSDSDLSGFNFFECEFTECNMSLVKLGKTTFRDARFAKSKLLGLHFEDCSDLMISMGFTGCQLSVCSFFRLKLKKTIFVNSEITEVDFTETDLGSSIFDNCDLRLTTFHKTNLEGVDFRTSFNYSIDPELNRIKKAKFSMSGLAGLLNKYDIEVER